MVNPEWKQVRLGQAITLQRGFDLPYRVRRPGNIPIVTSSGFNGTHDQAQVPGPGVVTGRYGTIGEVFYIEEDFWPLNTTLFVKNFNGNDPLFISYLLRTIDFQSHSGKSGVPGVNRNDLHEIPILLPPLPEQRAIAVVLSDADKLIDALNNLIAKKRDLKQAAMQQLLTGKKRLPGFSGEWETKLLGEILRVRHGKSQREVISSGGKYPILATSGEIGRTNEYLYDQPSVLIGRKGTIDKPQFMDSPFWTIDTLFYTEIFNVACPKFIYYMFCMINWQGLNEASGVPSLNASTIEKIAMLLPQADEQTAIAGVLTDMDAEIAALEQRRDKTRVLKQGMMQELLTGNTRLV
jgi:type I restriction enzyme S subunit